MSMTSKRLQGFDGAWLIVHSSLSVISCCLFSLDNECFPTDKNIGFALPLLLAFRHRAIVCVTLSAFLIQNLSRDEGRTSISLKASACFYQNQNEKLLFKAFDRWIIKILWKRRIQPLITPQLSSYWDKDSYSSDTYQIIINILRMKFA